MLAPTTMLQRVQARGAPGGRGSGMMTALTRGCPQPNAAQRTWHITGAPRLPFPAASCTRERSSAIPWRAHGTHMLCPQLWQRMGCAVGVPTSAPVHLAQWLVAAPVIPSTWRSLCAPESSPTLPNMCSSPPLSTSSTDLPAPHTPAGCTGTAAGAARMTAGSTLQCTVPRPSCLARRYSSLAAMAAAEMLVPLAMFTSCALNSHDCSPAA
mmetsp:Transcript_19774/g.50187  ORF Transcript_19774/g.50187 Transcript_19774/m.50187 type:complete len:211 (-) Transcript_19774:504-1136(-)